MSLEEDRSIGKWISIIHRQSQIYINKELKEYNINSSEYIYLVNLSYEISVNQKYLSDILCIDEALTTRVIRSLEGKGYVIREKNKSDKRSYDVRLSEKGEKLQPIIKQKLKDWTDSISMGMDETEVISIIKRLKYMSKNAVNTIRKEHGEKR